MNAKNILELVRHMGINDLANIARSALIYGLEPDRVFSNPFFAQIEPTTKCNLSCEICLNPRLTKKEDLSFDGFRMILGKLPHLRKISLVGRGEPLLNGDIFNMVRFAKSKRMLVGFATNGTIINRSIINEIVSSGVDWVNISIDSASKDKLETMRAGLNYKILLDNIKNLSESTNGSSRPRVAIWTVLTDKNIDELEAIVLLTKKMNIKNLCFQGMHFWGKRSSDRKRIDPSLLSTRLREARAVARKNHINFSYYNMPINGNSRACKRPWLSYYISVDGYITPCCLHGADPRNMNFGNIFAESFEAIWNNEKYRNFRKALKASSAPPLCVNCSSYNRCIKI